VGGGVGRLALGGLGGERVGLGRAHAESWTRRVEVDQAEEECRGLSGGFAGAVALFRGDGGFGLGAGGGGLGDEVLEDSGEGSGGVEEGAGGDEAGAGRRGLLEGEESLLDVGASDEGGEGFGGGVVEGGDLVEGEIGVGELVEEEGDGAGRRVEDGREVGGHWG